MNRFNSDQPLFLLNASEGQGGADTTPPTPAPASTPPASAGSGDVAPSEAPAGDDFDFGSILDGDGDTNTGVVAAPVVAAPTPVVAPAPVAPVAPVAAPAAAPAPGAPVAPAAAAPAAAPGPQEAIPPLDPAEPGAIAEAMRAGGAALITQLATTAYALSPEEAEELESNALAAIPKLQAKAHVQVMQSVMTFMSKAIPAMITQHATVQRRHDESENKFYTRWPDLKKDQHGPMIRQMANTYRKLNPNCTLDQMIEELGPFAMMQAKVVPGAPRPGAPQPAAVVSNGRPPQPSPFQPAVGGMPTPIPQPGGEDNPWGALDPANQG